jgi:ElaB/YqjD/DUF883 family membrane-anchored ribosome-binding protein
MKTNEIQDKAQEWQGEAKDAARNLQSKLKDKAADLQEAAQEWQQRAAEATRKAARATDEYVHENPWPVVASVAVGCLVLGFLLGRSRD